MIAVLEIPFSVQIALLVCAAISGFIIGGVCKIPGEDDRYQAFVDECARTDWLIRFIENGGQINAPASYPLIRSTWTLTAPDKSNRNLEYIVGSGATPRDAIEHAMKTFDLEKWGPKS